MYRNVVNVQEYGATGDGRTDDTKAIQAAFKEAVESNKSAVFFPATNDFYKMTGTVVLEGVKGLKIYGEGMDSTIIRNTSKVASEKVPLFIVTKRKDANDLSAPTLSEQIYFEKMTLQRGEAHDGDAKMDNVCLRIEHTNRIYFKKLKLTNSDCGISIKNSTYVYMEECITYKMTFAHVSLRECVSNVYIKKTIMDTTTSTLINARYLMHMGVSNYVDLFEFDAKNIVIDNCQFRNNPGWEGIDSHGVTNLTIKNCTIENCASGIMVGKLDKGGTKNLFGDIKICNNTIIQGTGNSGLSGIMVKGGQHPVNNQTEYGTALGENILITGNTIQGFGSHGSYYVAGIFVQNAKNVTVNANIVDESVQTSFGMMYVFSSFVYDNQFINTKRAIPPEPEEVKPIFPIWLGPGCYFLDFYRNKIVNQTAFPITHGVYNRGRGMANYYDNTIISAGDKYNVQNAQMTGILTRNRIGIQGWSKVRRQDGKVLQLCTNPAQGAAVQSIYEATPMIVKSLPEMGGDGMTSRLEFSQTILNYLSICEEFELDLPTIGKKKFVLADLENGKIGIVRPEVPEEFEGITVWTVDSVWQEV